VRAHGASSLACRLPERAGEAGQFKDGLGIRSRIRYFNAVCEIIPQNRKGWLRIGVMDMEILNSRLELTGDGNFSTAA
jgi:hypothetical protein